MKYVTLLITLCVIAVNIIYGINISRSLYKEKKYMRLTFYSISVVLLIVILIMQCCLLLNS